MRERTARDDRRLPAVRQNGSAYSVTGSGRPCVTMSSMGEIAADASTGAPTPTVDGFDAKTLDAAHAQTAAATRKTLSATLNVRHADVCWTAFMADLLAIPAPD
jgi:hypothetical protein